MLRSTMEGVTHLSDECAMYRMNMYRKNGVHMRSNHEYATGMLYI